MSSFTDCTSPAQTTPHTQGFHPLQACSPNGSSWSPPSPSSIPPKTSPQSNSPNESTPPNLTKVTTTPQRRQWLIEVSGVSSRTFAVWTFLAGIIRFHAAYDISNPTYPHALICVLMEACIRFVFGRLVLRGFTLRVSGSFTRLLPPDLDSSVPSSSQVTIPPPLLLLPPFRVGR
jgi:Erg28 like protein